MDKVNLLGLSPAALDDFCAARGMAAYRGRQIFRWLHRGGVYDFARMSDLPESLRSALDRDAVAHRPRLVADSRSFDGCRKWLFAAGDGGAAVEAVLIPEARRSTLCVSTQVGCALACGFCRTGVGGFTRNLSAAEIVGQLAFAREAGFAVSNVVMMGMGEPLLNLSAVLPALEVMTAGWGLSRRKVTVSTAGIVPGIDRLRSRCPVALAVSLHAPDDALRDSLMPINRRYPLAALLAACRRYLADAPRDFITFEYAPLAGVNDSPAQAARLLEVLRETPAKINLIPFNPFPGARYRASPPAVIRAFRDRLAAGGMTVTIRKTRGDDISAACGQLAGRIQNGRTIRFAAGSGALQSSQAAAA